MRAENDILGEKLVCNYGSGYGFAGIRAFGGIEGILRDYRSTDILL